MNYIDSNSFYTTGNSLVAVTHNGGRIRLHSKRASLWALAVAVGKAVQRSCGGLDFRVAGYTPLACNDCGTVYPLGRRTVHGPVQWGECTCTHLVPVHLAGSID